MVTEDRWIINVERYKTKSLHMSVVAEETK